MSMNFLIAIIEDHFPYKCRGGVPQRCNRSTLSVPCKECKVRRRREESMENSHTTYRSRAPTGLAAHTHRVFYGASDHLRPT